MVSYPSFSIRTSTMEEGRKTPNLPASHSPYASTVVEIYFRDGGPLRLHKEILRKSPALFAQLKENQRSSHTSIQIDDMLCSAGHIMIHYLLTDTYSASNKEDTSPESKKAELTTALQVYRSAKKYEMEGLSDLASQDIKRLFMELDLIALLKVLEFEFPGMCSIENWTATYLANRIRSDFEALTHESATLLLHDIGRIESMNDIVLKCMLQLCRERLSLNDNGNNMECSVSTINDTEPLSRSVDSSDSDSDCFTTETVELSEPSDTVSIQ